jgi:hypothetical protein
MTDRSRFRGVFSGWTGLAILLSVLMLGGACRTALDTPGNCRRIIYGDQELPGKYFTTRATIDEVERENMIGGSPFGNRNGDWDAFLAEIADGDEIWRYRDIGPLAGAEGYALIRNCEVIAFITSIKY